MIWEPSRCVREFEVVRRWKNRATRLVILFVFPTKMHLDGVILVKSWKDETRRLLSYQDINLSFKRNDFSVCVCVCVCEWVCAYPTQPENFISKMNLEV